MLKKLITRWFRASTPPRASALDMGQVIAPLESDVLDDGVDYRRPVPIPWYVDRSPAALRAYLSERQLGADGQAATYRFQFDGQRSTRYDGRVWMPVEDPLEEWDWQTRKEVLTNCHAAYHRNPIAKAAVDLTRRFVVGKGHTVTALNRDVQAVIDRFRANPENDIHGYDRAFIQDVQIDGELFVRVFCAGGETVITPVPPWYVRGANSDAGFLRRVIAWTLEWAQSGELLREDVPAADVIHVAVNRHGYELRGRPDLYVILPWLRAYNEWLVDRARQNKWRSALLWLVRVTSMVPGAIAKVRAAWRKPPTPGSVAVVPENVQVSALNNPVAANDASEDGRQIKLMSAVGVGVPEYMLSDGENANLASATAQQLPALWKFTDGQQLMAEQVWTPIYRRVIQAAIDAGDLPAEVVIHDMDGQPVLDATGAPRTITALQAFEVNYYELQAGDPKTLAEAIALLTEREIMSIETGRNRLGLDPVAEDQRLMRERDRTDAISPDAGASTSPASGTHRSAGEVEEALPTRARSRGSNGKTPGEPAPA